MAALRIMDKGAESWCLSIMHDTFSSCHWLCSSRTSQPLQKSAEVCFTATEILLKLTDTLGVNYIDFSITSSSLNLHGALLVPRVKSFMISVEALFVFQILCHSLLAQGRKPCCNRTFFDNLVNFIHLS